MTAPITLEPPDVQRRRRAVIRARTIRLATAYASPLDRVPLSLAIKVAIDANCSTDSVLNADDYNTAVNWLIAYLNAHPRMSTIDDQADRDHMARWGLTPAVTDPRSTPATVSAVLLFTATT